VARRRVPRSVISVSTSAAIAPRNGARTSTTPAKLDRPARLRQKERLEVWIQTEHQNRAGSEIHRFVIGTGLRCVHRLQRLRTQYVDQVIGFSWFLSGLPLLLHEPTIRSFKLATVWSALASTYQQSVRQAPHKSCSCWSTALHPRAPCNLQNSRFTRFASHTSRLLHQWIVTLATQ
jgi:hypothetical protein